MYKKTLLLLLAAALLSCAAKKDILHKIFAFPNSLDEISAVEVTQKSDWIWTLEDSGGNTEVYAFDLRGKLLNTLVITDAINIDWEELTSDVEGNLYIGDFGNNKNERKDLCIYKINAAQLKNSKAEVAAKICFYYPEQTDFQPKKSRRFYDLEAFFIHNDTFYLFTKNKSSKSDGTTMLYTVPNQPGNHAAKLVGLFKTCADAESCAITSADLSPDGTKMVLLSYGHMWLFSNYKNDDFFGGKVQQINFPTFTQKEGICFSGNKELFVIDERKNDIGGNLYQVKLSNLKSKPQAK